MAAAVPLTLDTSLRQVLVNFPQDANGFLWHRRLLVNQGPDARWVAATPTEDVELIDLANFPGGIYALRRNAPQRA